MSTLRRTGLSEANVSFRQPTQESNGCAATHAGGCPRPRPRPQPSSTLDLTASIQYKRGRRVCAPAPATAHRVRGVAWRVGGAWGRGQGPWRVLWLCVARRARRAKTAAQLPAYKTQCGTCATHVPRLLAGRAGWWWVDLPCGARPVEHTRARAPQGQGAHNLAVRIHVAVEAVHRGGDITHALHGIRQQAKVGHRGVRRLALFCRCLLACPRSPLWRCRRGAGAGGRPGCAR